MQKNSIQRYPFHTMLHPVGVLKTPAILLVTASNKLTISQKLVNTFLLIIFFPIFKLLMS